MRFVLIAVAAAGAIVLAGCGGPQRTELKADSPMTQSELEGALRAQGIEPVNPSQSQPGRLSFELGESGKCTASLLHRATLRDENGREVKRSAARPEFELQVFNASGGSILKLSSGWNIDRLKSEASTRHCFDLGASPSSTSVTSR